MADPHPPLAPARRDALRKKFRRVALVVIVIAVGLAVWGIASRLETRSELRKTTTAESVPTVVTAKPQWSGAGDELVLPGIVQAYIESPIYARTSGYLKSWRTDIGAKVHKGDLLAEIETPEVDRQYAQAKADLATAQANLAIAVITNQRWQGLLKTQAVSVQDADNRAADAAAKKTTVDSAEQNVARLRELEGFKRVLAPFDGVVTARNTDVGYLINAGQSPGTELFRLADIPPPAHLRPGAGGLCRGDRRRAQGGSCTSPSAPAPPMRRIRSGLPGPWTRPRAPCRWSCSWTIARQISSRVRTRKFTSNFPRATRRCACPPIRCCFGGKNEQVAVVDRDGTIELKDIDPGRDFGKTIDGAARA